MWTPLDGRRYVPQVFVERSSLTVVFTTVPLLVTLDPCLLCMLLLIPRVKLLLLCAVLLPEDHERVVPRRTCGLTLGPFSSP